jgi:hypothetical protein
MAIGNPISFANKKLIEFTGRPAKLINARQTSVNAMLYDNKSR